MSCLMNQIVRSRILQSRIVISRSAINSARNPQLRLNVSKPDIGRITRICLALLTTISGTAQIASLWFGALTEAAVIDVVMGATYLIVAIGLFGQSRFSLFMAALLPGSMVLELAYSGPTDMERIRMAMDTIIALGSALLLWRARHTPSN
jgi:hypothetical protein